MFGEKCAYRFLLRKPEGKRPLGRFRRRWEDNTQMVLQGVGRGTIDWGDLAQDKDRWREVVKTVMKLRGSIKWGNCLTNWEPVSFLRRTLLHGVSK
jgi:hypothetical protein